MEKSKSINDDANLTQTLLDAFISENMDDFVDPDRQIFYRGPKVVVDYSSSTWGRWLDNPTIHDPNSKIAKIFMLRFRVPFILFDQKIKKMCIENNVFEMTYESKATVPIEFKILLALRLLGRGNCYDDINELSQVISTNSSPTFLVSSMMSSFVFLANPLCRIGLTTMLPWVSLVPWVLLIVLAFTGISVRSISPTSVSEKRGSRPYPSYWYVTTTARLST